MKVSLAGLWQVLKEAGKGFVKDKVPKLSASLAYYTIFSMGPMMIVIIFLANMFWEKQAVEGSIYNQVKQLVGNKAALQIQEIIRNASVTGNNTLTAIVGFATLLIGATTLFSEMQDSINTIWRLKAKTEKGWIKMLLNRLRSFSLVVSLGFLLLVSLVISAAVEGLMNRLRELFPDITVIILYVLNLLITLVVTWLLFAVIFKLLPDAVIRWKDISVGALFTAVLFMIGKFAITFYIGRSDIGSTYGTAGSLVVLLLWVYFSAFILYFGAEFTKVYAVKYGKEIKPNDYAVTMQTIQFESEKDNIQDNEKHAAVMEAQQEGDKD
jgi:membrane protein